jgi:hypothetical protein
VARSLLTGLVLASLFGCRAAAERAVIQPLPDDAPPQAFIDLLSRARLQAMAANEAFYIDQWNDIDDAARSLDQSARFLHQAKDVPTNRKASLDSRADQLAVQATQLRTAAKNRDVPQTNATLQRIHMIIRELRSEG